jgi:hypothetical protein
MLTARTRNPEVVFPIKSILARQAKAALLAKIYSGVYTLNLSFQNL